MAAASSCTKKLPDTDGRKGAIRMKHLWEMTLDELLNPQGHACSCGRVHRCGLKMLRWGKARWMHSRVALAATQVRGLSWWLTPIRMRPQDIRWRRCCRPPGIPYTLYRSAGGQAH